MISTFFSKILYGVPSKYVCYISAGWICIRSWHSSVFYKTKLWFLKIGKDFILAVFALKCVKKTIHSISNNLYYWYPSVCPTNQTNKQTINHPSVLPFVSPSDFGKFKFEYKWKLVIITRINGWLVDRWLSLQSNPISHFSSSNNFIDSIYKKESLKERWE